MALVPRKYTIFKKNPKINIGSHFKSSKVARPGKSVRECLIEKTGSGDSYVPNLPDQTELDSEIKDLEICAEYCFIAVPSK